MNQKLMYLDSVNYTMFNPCVVIGSNVPSYDLKRNMNRLKVIAKENFVNLKNITLSDFNFQMAIHVTENENRL